MEYDVRTLDPNDPETPAPLLRGYLEAVNRGFHLVRADSRGEDVWLRDVRGNSARLHGAWLPAGSFGESPVPVATVTSWDGELNTGAEVIDLHMISDVTVAPSSRRQGLARRLLSADLTAAAAAGKSVAALTVSEGGIYRRFGFGPATQVSKVEVDVTRRFAFDDFSSFGRTVVLEPAELGDVPSRVFAQWHATHRGSISRPAGYSSFTHGGWDWSDQAPSKKMRAVVHLDDADEPHGYALYEHGGWGDDHTVKVRDLASVSTEGELALWDFLAGIDLTDRVTATVRPDHPLAWALTDPRCVSAKGPSDHIWVRILDVPAALAARPWSADGEVVLGVVDALGLAEGRWAVSVRDGRATVTPSDAAPQVSLDVSTLGSLYLGVVTVDTLVAVGRVRGDADALHTWAAMSDGGPVPYSLTSF
ncbi:GNAT family N-acetyltransferase [Nocardioides jishulii]|uniref:GNAT family N-acetyltransferase n=1 Tax=Nocardioides jishulii TaxID=2575440 RepID=A0A4U2YSD0_9ACTN|nr:GNAT family N-acetyltransferase [Nocardioides jishulii]QCX28681.1 GNAT family N-acetyltransferase [Nocardioides jishulii]TKI64426.1 GNAT family N-acetyltransferase [Nocardioides jishulii]